MYYSTKEKNSQERIDRMFGNSSHHLRIGVEVGVFLPTVVINCPYRWLPDYKFSNFIQKKEELD